MSSKKLIREIKPHEIEVIALTAIPDRLGVKRKTAMSSGREKPRSRKKTWGIFYTPEPLIHHLTNWALRSSTDTILEPSFGGCGFLAACATRLAKLGVTDSWSQMAGCDIDARAFVNLPLQFQLRSNQRRFLQKNFLETVPEDYPQSEFSVVIGNPPYVSRHNMLQYQLATARKAAAVQKVRVSSRASLWAYFVIHSLRFLKSGGKMAWVLPRTLTQGDYGKEIVRMLSTRFDRIDILCLGDRAFISAGAEEFVDILLCEGFRKKEGDSVNVSIHHLAQTPPINSPLVPENVINSRLNQSPREQSLSIEENEAVQTCLASITPVALKNYADAKIGLVTGATDFFVLRQSQLSEVSLSEKNCRVILSRFGCAQGLQLDTTDAEALVANDSRVLLVDAKNPKNDHYWSRFPADRVKQVKTFKKRAFWNDPDDGVCPDGFFPPLIHQYPRLVLNNAKINCTNTVHRVLFKEHISTSHRRAIAVSMLSTPTQISCELVGRQCGSGGLKIEPGDFAKIAVPTFTQMHLQTARHTSELIDAALRRMEVDTARKIADDWLFSGLDKAPSLEKQAQARSALLKLQTQRFRL